MLMLMMFQAAQRSDVMTTITSFEFPSIINRHSLVRAKGEVFVTRHSLV